MSPTQFRFLPWTRRGLVAELTTTDTGAPMPARAKVRTGIVITNVPGESGIELSVYGPGDVLGIDLRLIVRTDPRPNVTDVEPNYFPAIEFDPPDLPWMFTPARAGADDRLRPWLVLVVLDQQHVGRPVMEPGRPLPTIRIPGSVAASELPDLNESWAWAHTQVATTAGPGAIESELAAQPNLNVSRIMCPRRLEAGHSYLACLVPAFSVGVLRGLGGEPAPDAAIAPAWDVANPGEVVLPVYYHWEFATGPEGDFEALARKLRPFKCPETIGVQRMLVGDAGPEFPDIPQIPADQEAAYAEMDGALRAPKRESGRLDDIAGVLRDGLKKTLDIPADDADTHPGDDAEVLGPPIYGQWHAKLHRVPDDRPAWLREANLDPRSRAAAGLGAEVSRANQEEFMHAAWEQVGRVLEANELLSRGRLALEAARSLYERHLTALPADRLVQVLAPMHRRVLLEDRTVRAAIARTSLPDAATDPSIRRMASPQRPALKRAFRRSGMQLPESGAARSQLVRSLADGRTDVDPNRFVPDGILGVEALERVEVVAGRDKVSLAPIGLPIEIPVDVFQRLKRDGRSLRREFKAGPPKVLLRENIRATGVVVDRHVRDVGAVMEEPRAERTVAGVRINESLRRLIDAEASNPGAIGMLLTGGTRPRIDALDVDRRGVVSLRTPADRSAIPIAEVDEAAAGRAADVLANLPPATLSRRGGISARIGTDPSGRPVIDRATPARGPVTNTIPPLIKDGAVIARYESAFAKVVEDAQLEAPSVVKSLVLFALRPARTTLLQRTDPTVLIPLRIRASVTVAGGLLGAAAFPIDVAVTIDRVMAYPEIPAPAYAYLAKLDPKRFLPGVDQIPSDAITLVETNPRFVEAFMVGLNHEFARELLWREYPTDRRGSYFRHFWRWLDGQPDITPIHEWKPAAALGHTTRGGPGGQIVLLVRGQLLRRYPNTVVYAWREENGKLKDPPGPGDIHRPVFAGQFDPDITFFGFDLVETDLPQLFMVLQEQPTEPRFAFDEPNGQPAGAPAAWSDASWGHVAVNEGAHLKIEGNPLSGVARGPATFVTNAAHLAHITLQKPMRVAVHAKRLVEQP